jgi:hypothetical protein
MSAGDRWDADENRFLQSVKQKRTAKIRSCVRPIQVRPWRRRGQGKPMPACFRRWSKMMSSDFLGIVLRYRSPTASGCAAGATRGAPRRELTGQVVAFLATFYSRRCVRPGTSRARRSRWRSGRCRKRSPAPRLSCVKGEAALNLYALVKERGLDSTRTPSSKRRDQTRERDGR